MDYRVNWSCSIEALGTSLRESQSPSLMFSKCRYSRINLKSVFCSFYYDFEIDLIDGGDSGLPVWIPRHLTD